jgi:hypothetical protein
MKKKYNTRNKYNNQKKKERRIALSRVQKSVLEHHDSKPVRSNWPLRRAAFWLSGLLPWARQSIRSDLVIVVFE